MLTIVFATFLGAMVTGWCATMGGFFEGWAWPLRTANIRM
jgi:hypothetical protein